MSSSRRRNRPYAVVPAGRAVHYASCVVLDAREGVRELTAAQALYWLGRVKGRKPCALCQPSLTALRVMQ